MPVPAGRTPTVARARPLPPRVTAIADAAVLGRTRVLGALVAIAESGIQWIQLRAKSCPDLELFQLAAQACRALAGSGARLWMTDRAEVAGLLPFDGIHLGQSDLPPRAARLVVGDRLWLGRSTHDEAQVRAADEDPDVDVIAVGPVFPTSGKADPAPVVGLDFVARARRLTAKPLLAIGGISADNAGAVWAAGADSVVALGAICRGEVIDNCRRLLAAAPR